MASIHSFSLIVFELTKKSKKNRKKHWCRTMYRRFWNRPHLWQQAVRLNQQWGNTHSQILVLYQWNAMSIIMSMQRYVYIWAYGCQCQRSSQTHLYLTGHTSPGRRQRRIISTENMAENSQAQSTIIIGAERFLFGSSEYCRRQHDRDEATCLPCAEIRHLYATGDTSPQHARCTHA